MSLPLYAISFFCQKMTEKRIFAVIGAKEKLFRKFIIVRKITTKTMEKTTTPVEKLIEKAEIYSKTSLELCKYNAVYKSAEIFSTLITKLVIIIALAVFCMLTNIGLSIWIGNLIGQIYFGFFILAFIYLLIAILLYYFRYDWIKKPVSNFIINKLLKPHQDENQK